MVIEDELAEKLRKRFAKFEHFDLDGGHPVLDFTNTVDWRGTGRDHDWLGDFTDLLAWSHRTGYLPDTALAELASHAAEHPQSAAAALDQAREMREALFGLLRAAASGGPPARDDLEAFNRHLRRALSRAVLRRGSAPGGRYALELERGENPLEDIPLRLARQAADLLTSLDPARLKICGNPECGWLFLDTSRNASRRWCDMAGCGNRAKAKRFYDKRKRPGGNRRGGGALRHGDGHTRQR